MQSHTQCGLFTFEHSKAADTQQTPSPSSTHNSSTHGAAQDELLHGYTPVFAIKLEHIVDKACMIPTVLGYIPEPKSAFCIWKAILRAVAMRQSNILEHTLPFPTECSDDLVIAADGLLVNTETFPAQVALIALLVFVSLRFVSVDSMLAHARECVDTVLCALLSVAPEDLSKDRSAMQLLTLTVDRFMLSRDSSMMYEKIMREIRQSSATALPRRSPGGLDVAAFPAQWKARCVRHSARLSAARAPADKLSALVRLLQYISTFQQGAGRSTSSEVNQETATEGVLVEHPASRVGMRLSSDTADSEDEDEGEEADAVGPIMSTGTGTEGWITYTTNTAALFDSSLSLADSPPVRSKKEEEHEEEDEGDEDVDVVMVGRGARTADTDQLLAILTYVLYLQQKEGVLDWFSECRYLGSALGDQEQQIMNGPQGYALVTLQQALYCLCQGNGAAEEE